MLVVGEATTYEAMLQLSENYLCRIVKRMGRWVVGRQLAGSLSFAEIYAKFYFYDPRITAYITAVRNLPMWNLETFFFEKRSLVLY